MDFIEKPTTPTPDYDSLVYSSNNSTSSEEQQQPVIAKKTIPPPPPPMMKHSSPTVGAARINRGGPAALSKPNRPISVTIGEYDSRKEPSKLGFINKGNDFRGSCTSEMLQNELQMTLSRSNLRRASEAKNAQAAAKGTEVETNKGSPKVSPKSVLEKTGSANIERLTAMLNSRNNGSNTVTISIPKTKAESEVKISPNGILKTAPTNGVNGGAHTAVNGGGGAVGGGSTVNGEVKNIKFDNM